jgi:tetratricopeptide (TPR) repeat protein
MKENINVKIVQKMVSYLAIAGCCMLMAPFAGSSQTTGAAISHALLKDSLQQYKAEVQAWNKVIAQHPAMAQAWHLRGKAKYQLKDYRGAVADQQKALQLHFINEHVYLASAYSRLALKEYHAAIRDFSKAIAINPSNSISWYHRGFTRQKLQQQKQARLDFRMANELGLRDARDILTEFEPE